MTDSLPISAVAHQRGYPPPPTPLTEHRERHIKAVTVCSFYCSRWFHTARLSVSQESWVFIYYWGQNWKHTVAKTAAQRASRCRKNTETPSWRGLRCRRAAALRAADKNYCSFSSAIPRPLIFPSARPINKPLSQVSKTNNINDFKRENKYQRKEAY